jgi:hypothetical protein
MLKHTSTIQFKAVSDPMDTSVPGTLLLTVAGTQTMGILNSGYFSLFLLRATAAAYPSQPPISNIP